MQERAQIYWKLIKYKGYDIYIYVENGLNMRETAEIFVKGLPQLANGLSMWEIGQI